MRWPVRALPYICPLILGGVCGLVVTGVWSSTLRAQGVLPAISLLAPSAGLTLSGAVTVWAAADNVGVAGLQFQANGVNVGPQITSGTCSTAWNTAAVTDGAYTLVAIASDGAGNTITSAPVTVTVENAVPIIASVAVSNLQASTATVTWTTNQAAGTQLDYGTTALYGTSTALDSTWVTLHAQTLTGLTANTTYHFRVRSWNPQFLFSTSADFVLTTTGATGPPTGGCLPPDPYANLGGGTCTNGSWSPPGAPVGAAPPLISRVTVVNVNASTATIMWTTNQLSDSEVDYGPTATYGISAPVDPQLVTTHNTILIGLSAGTTYHFRVGSWNPQGVPAMSGDAVFTTLSKAPPNPPTSPPPPAAIVPPSSGGNNCTTPDPFLAHGGWTCKNGSWSPPSAPVGTAPPQISGVTTPYISDSGATFTWTTDQLSDTEVNYGTTTYYGTGQVDATLVTTHRQTVSGLSAGTTYHFRVTSWNAHGVPSVSGDFIFTTLNDASSSPSSNPSSCATSDPFVFFGGGTCLNGGWLPPGFPSTGSTVGPGSGSNATTACASPDPYTILGGGICRNGGWVPPGFPGTGLSNGLGSASVPPSDPSICTTLRPGPQFVCVNGGWRCPAGGCLAPSPIAARQVPLADGAPTSVTAAVATDTRAPGPLGIGQTVRRPAERSELVLFALQRDTHQLTSRPNTGLGEELLQCGLH